MTDKQTIKGCPHWSPDCAQSCTLTAGGLYLPLPHQIAQFCSTPQWAHCPQYVRGCETKLDQAGKSETAQDSGRRNFPRFACRHGLTLAIADNPGGQPGETKEQRAWAIDLSLGGMRIETAHALPASAKISFSFGDDFPLPGLIGQAEVYWQRPDHRTGTHQYGLGFSDQRLSLALGEFLGKC